VRVASKDTGPLDNTCFQILYETEIITLRASSSSEKRQWINQVESAKKAWKVQRPKSTEKMRNSSQDTIGTLNVLLLSLQNCKCPGKYRKIFAVGRINDQILKSKMISTADGRFNQSLIFTLPSLDTSFQIELYNADETSLDGIVFHFLTVAFLGQGEMQLDLLEYYIGKQTEDIVIPLKDSIFDTMTIKMMYKP
jgi:hypothetical protein